MPAAGRFPHGANERPAMSAIRQKSLSGLAPWVGGKRLLAREIIRRIGEMPHTCYAGPFIGMGGVFLRRPARSKAEAINDLSGDVSTLGSAGNPVLPRPTLLGLRDLLRRRTVGEGGFRTAGTGFERA